MLHRALPLALAALVLSPIALGTAPIVGITLQPSAPDGAGGWYKTAGGVKIVYTCSDAVDRSNVTLQYQLDGMGGSVTAPVSVTATEIAKQVDGAYVATASCVDGAKEAQSAAPISFKLDRTPPGVVASQYVKGRDAAQEIVFTLADEASGLSRTVVEHDLYGDHVWRPVCTVALTGLVDTEACALDLSQGRGVWCFRATTYDLAGNTEGPVPLRLPQDGSPLTPDDEIQAECFDVNWA